MQQYMNRALLGLLPSGIRAFTALAKQTPGCTLLTIGEPDFSTPEAITARAQAALDAGMTHYPANCGDMAYRNAVADFENRSYGYDYLPEEVILTTGATEALFVALQGTLNPGDEVLIPTPAFGLYESIVRLSNAVPVRIDTTETDFVLTAQALQEHLTDKTRMLILNTPNNPTGCVYTDDELREIHDVLVGKPIFVVCDDVYRQLSYQPMHSLAQFRDLRKQLLVVQSFSKPYAMTGWRLGYLMGDKPIIEKLTLLHAACVVSIPAFCQPACEVAFSQTQQVAEMVQTYQQRRDYIDARLREMGLPAKKPGGAFYIFPDIRKFGMSSEDFCRRMILEGKVAGVPGSCFGAEGFVRFSFCYDLEEIRRGMDKLERFVKQIGETT